MGPHSFTIDLAGTASAAGESALGDELSSRCGAGVLPAGRGRPDDEETTLDFWDLTKVLFRRWAIALPMLLLTAGLTMLAFTMLKPDYVSTSYVQLVPPIPQPTKPNQAPTEQRNPWLGQGLQTLGNAAIVTIQDKSVVDHFKSVGLSDVYTFEMGSTSPMIKIEVTADSRKQAEDTANELITRFNTSVTSLQTAYGVPTVDLITARRLDLGSNVEKSDSNVKRGLVAVFGAGMLLTVATTVGVDAWLRRRNGPLMTSADVETSQDRAIGMAAAAGLPEQPTMGHRPRALAQAPKLVRKGPADEGWYARQPAVYKTAARSSSSAAVPVPGIPEIDFDGEELDDATIVIPNFLPKNGAEIIPPPSEWLVNDRDGDS
jgi:capsular polysaccharide biosynthesis protein